MTYQSSSIPVLPQLRRTEVRNSAAQAVSRDYDLEALVGVCSLLNSREHPAAGFHPGGPEACMGGAACADIGRYGGEVEVREPVLQGLGAAEGDDYETVGLIDGDEAGYVRC